MIGYVVRHPKTHKYFKNESWFGQQRLRWTDNVHEAFVFPSISMAEDILYVAHPVINTKKYIRKVSRLVTFM